MKLSDIIKFTDDIATAISSAVSVVEDKLTVAIDGVSAKIESLSARIDSIECEKVSSDAFDQIDAVIRAFEEKESALFASVEEKYLAAKSGLQIKSATADNGTILFEYADGKIDVVEVPVVSGVNGENGADGKDGVNGLDGADGKDGKNGVDGKDGKDGIDGKDGADGVDGVGIKSIETKHGEFLVSLTSGEEYRVELPKPPDPVKPREPIDVKDAMQNKDGHLVLVLSDGTTKDVGRVAGRDGSDGRDGRDGIDGLTGPEGPPGRDGVNGLNGSDGIDGVDGLGFDDMSVELMEDERTVVFKFQRGEKVKEFPIRFPVMLFRGAYIADTVYERGDVVSFGGSTYYATGEVIGEVPGTTPAWRQQTQAGRSVRGERGIPGKDGRNGADGKDRFVVGP